jgi:HYR domain/K319L-like, PKD domain
MNVIATRTRVRRWLLPLAGLITAYVLAQPAHAACQANSYHVNPNNQSVFEVDAANGYTPIQVSLGLNKPMADGVAVSWSQVSGPAVTLNTSNPAAPTFLTPSVPSAGAVLRFRLTSTCPGGSPSTDEGTVSVVNVNRPPVAYASASPAIAFDGSVITLNSTAPGGSPASSDPDGDSLIYQWTRTAGPAVTLADANTATASFTAPDIGSNYTLQFQLEVRDRPTGGLTSTASVVVNITTHNLPPLAVLQCPEQVNEGGQVVLNGSDSYDPNGQSLTYAWSQLQGTPSIAVGGETGNTVSFIAPVLTTGQDGFVEFQLKVTDTDGSWDLATCMLGISDITRPVITVSAPLPTEAESPAGAPVSYANGVSAVDNVDGDVSNLVVCVPPSGSTFALGNTTVDCEVDDSIGNTGQASFNVLVRDTIAPVIDFANDVAVEATGPDGAVITYDLPGTYDVVDVNLMATCAPVSGSQFALGSHAVTCNASDAAGNAATPTNFTATVHDTKAPVIDEHENITEEATSSAGALVTYVSPATHDVVDGAGEAICAPASGSLFALGLTTVTCNASDAAGNPADAISFTVNVADSTPPTIDAHDDVEEEATGSNGAIVDYTAPATHDAVDGDGVATCAPASGSQFALGSTVVTCDASDGAGNAATATTFTVNVVDTTPPAIDPHAGVTKEATGPAGATVTYTAPATHDAVDGDGAATCAPASGSQFAVGATTVECNASDAKGNHATPTTFEVNVVDTTPPTIDPHGDVGPVEATGPAGASVAYLIPAKHDLVDGNGLATCAPASGNVFPLGDTAVTCSAADHAGNGASPVSFLVKVRDTTAPLIAAHANLTAEATGPSGAVVSYASPATTDVVDGPGAASCLPASGSVFPLGVTTVNCHAHDAAGNVATATSFTVTVRDTTAPSIASHADVNAIATGNSSAVVTYDKPGASDLVDGPVVVNCVPASGSTFNVGRTNVTCSATDAAGNTATSTFGVVVSYTFNGFFRPIDSLPTINVVKAGSAIPVKFDLGGNQGLNIFAAGFPASVSTTCSASATDAIEETVTAGGSSLSYDAGTGQYIYVWKTEKSWTGCRQLQVKLKDGSSRWATFSFTR